MERKSLLSRIMKSAWTMFRKQAISFSAALKAAWKVCRQPKKSRGMNELCMAKVTRETEKAICVNLTIDTKRGREGWDVWFPKSQVSLDGGIFVSDWILDQKNAEISSRYRGPFFGIVCL